MRRHQAIALTPVDLSAETRRGQPGDNLGSICKPYLAMATLMASMSPRLSGLTSMYGTALGQVLTLVHFSAQLERFVWDRGCA